MTKRKVDVLNILPLYNDFYKQNKPDLTTRAGRRGARGEVRAIILDLSSRHPTHRFKSARQYVREMRKMLEAHQARSLYNLHLKAIRDINSVTEDLLRQILEGLLNRKTRKWFRRFKQWDEEDFKEQSSKMYRDTEKDFKAKTREIYNYPVSEDKMRYINNLNKYAYLPDQNREELNFEGVRGPANIEVIGHRPLKKSVKQNVNVDNLNQEIADIEYALRTNDFSKFYNNTLYFLSRKELGTDNEFYNKVGSWAIRARQDVKNNGYLYSGNMTKERLDELADLTATNHENSNPNYSLNNNPITLEDLIWLQNAPFYRNNIIASLQKRLNELRQ